jgi:hypothetical protein
VGLTAALRDSSIIIFLGFSFWYFRFRNFESDFWGNDGPINRRDDLRRCSS